MEVSPHEPVTPERWTSEGLIGAPLPPVFLSTYLSDSCSKGRLFEQSTYDEENFETFLDKFASQIVRGIPLPEHFTSDAVTLLFRQKLNTWSSDYKNAVKGTDPEDAGSVRKTVRKARDGGAGGLDYLIQYLKKDEFPTILWIELKRAKRAYLDSLEFMLARIEKWFSYAPKFKSQSKQRNKLARSMLHPFLPVFEEFGDSMAHFAMTLLFLEVWSRRDNSELFSDKPWTFENVDKERFEVAFRQVSSQLHVSISSLREAYFSVSGQHPVTLDMTNPVSAAFRQLVRMAEVR